MSGTSRATCLSLEFRESDGSAVKPALFTQALSRKFNKILLQKPKALVLLMILQSDDPHLLRHYQLQRLPLHDPAPQRKHRTANS
jgi:hypothetical protein